MHSQTWNWVFIHQALFLITGVASTICAQLVTYHGGAHPSTLMLSWPSYVGMLLVPFAKCFMGAVCGARC